MTVAGKAKALISAILLLTLALTQLAFVTDNAESTPTSQYQRVLADIQQIMDNVDENNIRQHIQDLQDFNTRFDYAGTFPYVEDYVYEHFSTLGIQTEKDPFELPRDSKVPGWTKRTINNIIAMIPGTDPVNGGMTVVFSAHMDSATYDTYASWDTYAYAPGADSGGSGMAALMEMARVLSPYQFPVTIKFIAFAGTMIDQQGSSFGTIYSLDTLGSKHYAEDIAVGEGPDGLLTSERIICDINFEEIGYTGADRQTNLSLIGQKDTEWVQDLLIQLNGTYEPGLNILKSTPSGGGGIAPSPVFRLSHRESPDMTPDGASGSRPTGVPGDPPPPPILSDTDCTSFWRNTYASLAVLEDVSDYNPYVWTASDEIQHLDIPFIANVTKLFSALAVELGEGNVFETARPHIINWPADRPIDFELNIISPVYSITTVTVYYQRYIGNLGEESAALSLKEGTNQNGIWSVTIPGMPESIDRLAYIYFIIEDASGASIHDPPLWFSMYLTNEKPEAEHDWVQKSPFNTDIYINATLSDDGKVYNCTLYYKNKTSGVYGEADMVLIDGDERYGNWSAKIPGEKAPTYIHYYFVVRDGKHEEKIPQYVSTMLYYNISVYDYAPVLYHTPASQTTHNTSIEINATVWDDVQTFSVVLTYKEVDSTFFKNTAMTCISGDDRFSKWRAVIPEQYVLGEVEYYITVQDIFHTVRSPVNSPNTHIIRILDLVKPTLAYTPSQTDFVGQEMFINVTLWDDYMLVAGTLFYREVNRTYYSSAPLLPITGVYGPGVWSATIPPQNKVGNVSYYMVIYDGTYVVTTPEYTVNLTDEGKPLISHVPPASHEIYHELSISAQITDDGGVKAARLYYKNVESGANDTNDANNAFQGITMNLTLGSNQNGTWNVTIPAQTSLGTLEYYIEAYDGYTIGRRPMDSSRYLEVEIVDTTDPVLAVESAAEYEANAEIPITVRVEDNVGVSQVIVIYTDLVTGENKIVNPTESNLQANVTSPGTPDSNNGTGNASNASSSVSVSLWTANIPAQNATGYLNFIVIATDTSGNNGTAAGTVSVIDVNPPLIEIVHVPQTARSGERIRIVVRVVDDIQVSEVLLFFKDSNAEVSEYENVTMEPTENPDEYAGYIPPQSAKKIDYFIQASDGTNRVTSPEDINYPPLPPHTIVLGISILFYAVVIAAIVVSTVVGTYLWNRRRYKKRLRGEL